MALGGFPTRSDAMAAPEQTESDDSTRLAADPAAAARSVGALAQSVLVVSGSDAFGPVFGRLAGQGHACIVVRDGQPPVALTWAKMLSITQQYGRDLFEHRPFETVLDVIGHANAQPIAPGADIQAAVRIALARPGADRFEPLVIDGDPPTMLDVLPLVIARLDDAESAVREATRQRERAEAADRARSIFLASMSHELRTPLNSILGFAQMLTGNMLGEEQRNEAAGIIERNGNHLLRLIDDLLDLTRLESTAHTLEVMAFSPENLVRDAIDALGPVAEARGNELDFEVMPGTPDRVAADPTRIRQVLYNLLGNAIKFTENGPIRVVTGPVDPAASSPRWSLEFVDSGIGMTPEQIECVFEPFVQADAGDTRRYGGSGLGLAIVRRIVDAHDGTIEIRSEAGSGTQIIVTLPVGDPAAHPDANLLDQTIADRARQSLALSVLGHRPEAVPTANARETPPVTESPDSPAAPAHRPRVLVVEDGPDNIRLFQTVLDRGGFEVVVVENGRDGIDAAESAENAGTPYDVILMDRHMPILDGVTATTELRSRGHRLPIVACSASASEEDQAEFLVAGANIFLAKPVAPPLLLRTLREILEEQSERRAAA